MRGERDRRGRPRSANRGSLTTTGRACGSGSGWSSCCRRRISRPPPQRSARRRPVCVRSDVFACRRHAGVAWLRVPGLLPCPWQHAPRQLDTASSRRGVQWAAEQASNMCSRVSGRLRGRFPARDPSHGPSQQTLTPIHEPKLTAMTSNRTILVALAAALATVGACAADDPAAPPAAGTLPPLPAATSTPPDTTPASAEVPAPSTTDWMSAPGISTASSIVASGVDPDAANSLAITESTYIEVDANLAGFGFRGYDAVTISPTTSPTW